MKNTNFIKLALVLSLAVSVLTGCSDEFLKEKRDFKKVTDIIYNSYVGAQLRVDNIYGLVLPQSAGDFFTLGKSTDEPGATEESGGLGSFVNGELSPMTAPPDFFFNEAKTSRSPWGRVRNCNDCIEGIMAGTLPQADKEKLLGQVYFLRAWVYYKLVVLHGGVPIVDYTQNPMASQAESLVIPRSTTKECIDFICSDLARAAEYLPFEWANSTDWGRVTAGAALALKGRILLWYASPLFNRTDNVSRWEAAYQANKNAIDTLTQGNFGLAYLDNPGVNALGWAKMFIDRGRNPEAVLVTLFNNVIDDNSQVNVWRNNSWENGIRPNNAMGGGGRGTTSQMVDLFPLADGQRAVDKDWQPIHGYNPDLFFKNRDPRFYRTYSFTGERWAFSEDPRPSGATTYPYNGPEYVLWNYCWYVDTNRRDSTDLAGLYVGSGYGADGLGGSYRGIYVRKKSDDLDINPAPLYTPYKTDGKINYIFRSSGAPYMEIRYAEVLLNFAEAACGANHGAEALAALRLIRQRVGYTGDCGLDESLAGDRAALFAAILYERQIELAFEGKRFDDMRRWLLWDGGTAFGNVDGAPATWTLTGFGGNTCAYLDVRPLNGRNRTGMDIAIKNTGPDAAIGANTVGQGQTLADIDPILKNGIARPAPIDLRQDLTPQLAALETFYTTYLVRKTKRVDGDQYKAVNYLPYYYIIGLSNSSQRNNSKLPQNIGWQDIITAAVGTFDPLAE